MVPKPKSENGTVIISSCQLTEPYKMNKGTLGLVLCLSRIMGILPYKLGFGCCKSKLLIAYSFVLVTFSSVCIIADNVLLFIFKNDNSKSSLIMHIIHLSCNNVLLLVIAIGVITAAKRIKHMNQCLKQLEKIHKKLIYISIPRDRRTHCLVLISILVTVAMHIADYCLLIFGHKNWYHHSIHITMQQFWLILIQMQAVAFAARVLLYLRAINDTLYKLTIKENVQTKKIKENRIVPKFACEHLASNKDAGRVRNVVTRYKSIPVKVATKVAKLSTSELSKDEPVEYTMRHISECYSIVCHIVRNTTEVDGKLMIAILLCHMLYSEMNLFRFIVWITGEERVTIDSVYLLGHSILHALALMVLVDPFHLTHVEMQRTSLLVQSLQFHCNDHQPLHNELEFFQRLLLLQKTTYSPLGMCTLDRSLIFKIFGTLISYLVILTTYGPPIDSPLLLVLSKGA